MLPAEVQCAETRRVGSHLRVGKAIREGFLSCRMATQLSILFCTFALTHRRAPADNLYADRGRLGARFGAERWIVFIER